MWSIWTNQRPKLRSRDISGPITWSVWSDKMACIPVMWSHSTNPRFVQHTARHERLDTLCGDEFQGFRGVPCGREECELNVLHNTSRLIPGGYHLITYLLTRVSANQQREKVTYYLSFFKFSIIKWKYYLQLHSSCDGDTLLHQDTFILMRSAYQFFLAIFFKLWSWVWIKLCQINLCKKGFRDFR